MEIISRKLGRRARSQKSEVRSEYNKLRCHPVSPSTFFILNSKFSLPCTPALFIELPVPNKVRGELTIALYQRKILPILGDHDDRPQLNLPPNYELTREPSY